MKEELWWEHHSSMQETYADLEWLVYNWDWEIDGIEREPDSFAEKYFGPMSEQIWAIKQDLAEEI